MKKSIKGIWLYGQSGSGKSTISKLIKKRIKNSFIIDGDIVRKKISFDLKHNLKDRIIQTKRLLGLSKICIEQRFFPIISCVYLGKKVATEVKKNKICLIKIERSNRFLNKKIKKKENIVGIDITQPNFKSLKLKNDENLINNLRKILR